MFIVHLFVSYAHVNLCHVFCSFWCRGLTAASDCGSSLTFLFNFFNIFSLFFFFKYIITMPKTYKLLSNHKPLIIKNTTNNIS